MHSDFSYVKHAVQAGGMALVGQDVCWDWLWLCFADGGLLQPTLILQAGRAEAFKSGA